MSAEGLSTAGNKNQTTNGNESMVRNANDQTLHSLSYDSNESTYEEETNERWASPWKAQHKNVEITTYYSPNNFYVAQKSELYVL